MGPTGLKPLIKPNLVPLLAEPPDALDCKWLSEGTTKIGEGFGDRSRVLECERLGVAPYDVGTQP